ncbi:MAG: excinuclease ABC subunit UvrB [Acidimicrobiia bacterium]
MPPFVVKSEFRPAGDQPEAIARLAEGIERGDAFQTLLGITGSGKSATMAWVIEKVQKPTLVLAPNKALGAQLANEFRQFFPDNRVEYFVSYYDYYQPEAYIPQTDTYIEKESTVNDEIDRLRHAATAALLARDDVIIVASVSAIYGLGSPEQYEGQLLRLVRGVELPLDVAVNRLVEIQYERNEVNLIRGRFRLRGDTLEIFPTYEETTYRVEYFGDEVERILRMNPVTGEILGEQRELFVFPATHYVTSRERLERSLGGIEIELHERLAELERGGKLLEAQRLRMRTAYDMEMMREVGFCAGIENYSRYLDGREPGERPYCLLDYFPDDYLMIIDESHVAIPQIHGQYAGDRSRKDVLVDHGFRLPSAVDNRPLTFEEWQELTNQVVLLSATPAAWELGVSTQVVEQIIRPTGLVDPEVVVRPTKGQIDDLVEEIRVRGERDQRVLVTTLTKKMSEDLTDYLLELGVKARYLHSDIDTLERVQILRDLRLGEYDVLVGVNLLREGLDLPEVSLVAILDADKEGFLRSKTSLIQTIGRASRNVDGQVVMYADDVTDSMQSAVNETNRRRKLQLEHNEAHGIDPQTIRKRVSDILELVQSSDAPAADRRAREVQRREPLDLPTDDLRRLIQSLEEEMHEAAKELRFEYAARLRDEVNELKRELREMADAMGLEGGTARALGPGRLLRPRPPRPIPSTVKPVPRSPVMAGDEPSRYQPSDRATRVAIALIAALAVAVIVATAAGSGGDAPGGRLGGDLPAFYGAGAIAAEGDWEALYEPQRQLLAQTGLWEDEGSFLYFAYPPQVAALYRPLVPLGYRTAYVVHTVLMALALLAAIVVVRPLIPWLGGGVLVPFAFALTFYPMLRAVTGGQNSALTLLLFAALARLDYEDRPVLAGVVAALALYKPQFGIPLVTLVLVSRRWKMLGGWAIGAAGFATFGAALAGAGWVGDWWSQAAGFRDLNVGANGENFISIAGLLEHVLGAGDGIAVVVGAVIAVAGLGLAALVWRRAPTSPLLRAAVAAAVIVAIMPQPLFYEAGLLLLAVGLPDERGMRWQIAAAGVMWSAGLLHLLAPLFGASPLVMLPVAVTAFIVVRGGLELRARVSSV